MLQLLAIMFVIISNDQITFHPKKENENERKSRTNRAIFLSKNQNNKHNRDETLVFSNPKQLEKKIRFHFQLYAANFFEEEEAAWSDD